MNNKNKRIAKHFRRIKYMGIAFIIALLGAFIPVAALSSIFGMIAGLLIFAMPLYFCCAAAREWRIGNVSEGIRDAKDKK